MDMILFLSSVSSREEQISGCCVLKCHLLMPLQGPEELEITVVVTEFFGREDIAWLRVKGHQKCGALCNNCIYVPPCESFKDCFYLA